MNFKEYINKNIGGTNLIVGIRWEWSDGEKLIDVLEGFEYYRDEIEREYPFHHVHVWRWDEKIFNERIGKPNGN